MALVDCAGEGDVLRDGVAYVSWLKFDSFVVVRKHESGTTCVWSRCGCESGVIAVKGPSPPSKILWEGVVSDVWSVAPSVRSSFVECSDEKKSLSVITTCWEGVLLGRLLIHFLSSEVSGDGRSVPAICRRRSMSNVLPSRMMRGVCPVLSCEDS